MYKEIGQFGASKSRSPLRKTELSGSPSPSKSQEFFSPEENAKQRLASAETLEGIREALGYVTEVQGSRAEPYTRDELLRTVETIEEVLKMGTFGAIPSILRVETNALGFREALQRVADLEQSSKKAARAVLPPTRIGMEAVDRTTMLKNEHLPLRERMEQVRTWEDLDLVLETVRGITGSRYYSPFEIRNMVMDVRAAAETGNEQILSRALGRATTGDGLRQALMQIVGLRT